MDFRLQEAFSHRPDIPLISPVRPLGEFIRQYPDESLHDRLNELEKDYHHYRQVKGDGNCFYRSCVFLYLSQADLNDYDRLFPPAAV